VALDVFAQLPCRLVALGRERGQAAPQDGRDRGSHVPVPPPHVRRPSLPGGDQFPEVEVSRRHREGALPGQQLVEDQSEGVQVAARVGKRPAVPERFEVLRRPDEL
jgi:hypothetical protein